jgi:hypothetical protein
VFINIIIHIGVCYFTKRTCFFLVEIFSADHEETVQYIKQTKSIFTQLKNDNMIASTLKVLYKIAANRRLHYNTIKIINQ